MAQWAPRCRSFRSRNSFCRVAGMREELCSAGTRLTTSRWTIFMVRTRRRKYRSARLALFRRKPICEESDEAEHSQERAPKANDDEDHVAPHPVKRPGYRERCR